MNIEGFDMEWEATCRDGAGNVGDCVILAHYCLQDPLCVSLTFCQDEEKEPTWEFARDLLLEAREGHPKCVGKGDIKVAFGARMVYIHLSSPSGSAFVQSPRGPFDLFIDKTIDMVAPGEEEIDVDAALEELLK